MQIIIHRCVYWTDDRGQQQERHGLKAQVVSAAFGAGIGLIVDPGNDPWLPHEMTLFVNQSGCLVVCLPWQKVADETPQHAVDLWLWHEFGWRPVTRWDHYTATFEDVAKNDGRVTA